MKEQIEEIQNTLITISKHPIMIKGLEHWSDVIAEELYNAGYRKQKEGEWITSDIPQEKYVCSVCGGACWYYDCQGDVAKSRYCPNCGASMKGGAE